MKTYTKPEMPVIANLWYVVEALPPVGSPDTTVPCSISPIKPSELFLMTQPQTNATVSHIIRCDPDPLIGENTELGSPGFVYPCSVWEFPQGSGHYYTTVMYQIVGSGFPNMHARVYIARAGFAVLPPPPLYRGWT